MPQVSTVRRMAQALQNRTELPWPEDCPTLDVVTAGRLFFGLSRTGSYEAVARGDIPTVKVRGRKYVPVAAVRQMLGLPVTRPAAA